MRKTLTLAKGKGVDITLKRKAPLGVWGYDKIFGRKTE
jgi:hypothetical protein